MVLEGRPSGRVGHRRIFDEQPPSRSPSAAAGAIEKSRRRPTLPGGSPPSTIGAGGLHFRVRNGNGCFPAAIATGNLYGIVKALIRTPERARAVPRTWYASRRKNPSPRPISTGRLNTSPCLHLRPINLVVYQGPYSVNRMGDLISRQASRLDAFSAYPFRR